MDLRILLAITIVTALVMAEILMWLLCQIAHPVVAAVISSRRGHWALFFAVNVFFVVHAFRLL